MLCTYVGCINGEVGLFGGDNLKEGRVEICVNGTWVTVCENSFDANDAVVICNQLGYPGLGLFVLKGKIWLTQTLICCLNTNRSCCHWS